MSDTPKVSEKADALLHAVYRATEKYSYLEGAAPEMTGADAPDSETWTEWHNAFNEACEKEVELRAYIRALESAAASRPEGDDSALLDRLESLFNDKPYATIRQRWPIVNGASRRAPGGEIDWCDEPGNDVPIYRRAGDTLRDAIRQLPEEEKENG